MSAVACFVKTLGLSPVKTRLAKAVGTAKAEAFYKLSVDCLKELLFELREQGHEPFLAVAEPEGLESEQWSGFACVSQGAGGLAERLHHVYQQLQSEHGSAILIGSDSPQLSADLVLTATGKLSQSPFVMGRADDGGFYLFAGKAPIEKSKWEAVTYSDSKTADQLIQQLGQVDDSLPSLGDVDEIVDLKPMLEALRRLPKPTRAQIKLTGWLLDNLPAAT